MKKLLVLLLFIVFAITLFSCGKTSIEISEDGYWIINGEKTDVLAKGDNAEASADENPYGLAFYLKPDETYAVGVGNAKYCTEIVISLQNLLSFSCVIFQINFGEKILLIIVEGKLLCTRTRL